MALPRVGHGAKPDLLHPRGLRIAFTLSPAETHLNFKMTTPSIPAPPLTGSHLRTYNTIFQHPVSHNLGWLDVLALFRHLGTVEEEHNGRTKFIRNGQALVLHPHQSKDVSGTEEVLVLRHFLEHSESTPVAGEGVTPHWLLVMDHQGARLFRSHERGTIPQHFASHDAQSGYRNTPHGENVTRGHETVGQKEYFAQVAAALQSSERLLILGSGTGTGSEMEQFVHWLTLHHPALRAKLIGTQAVDESHLSNDQLLAKSQQFKVPI